MEIETFNSNCGYLANYPISLDHGNIYGIQANYSSYQYASDNLIWNNSESFSLNQHSDLSDISSPPTSFYLQNQTINSTNSEDAPQQTSIVDSCVRGKRGRKKGTGKKAAEKVTKERNNSSKRSDSSPQSPTVMKKRRLAANARERRRMNGLNFAFDK